MKRVLLVAALLVAAYVFVANAGAAPKTHATVQVSPASGATTDTFVVSGCGYAQNGHNVAILFANQGATYWDSQGTVDTNGCFSITLVPFQPLDPGTYPVRAGQENNGGVFRWLAITQVTIT